jgi:hypothetical protein
VPATVGSAGGAVVLAAVVLAAVVLAAVVLGTDLVGFDVVAADLDAVDRAVGDADGVTLAVGVEPAAGQMGNRSSASRARICSPSARLRAVMPLLT